MSDETNNNNTIFIQSIDKAMMLDPDRNLDRNSWSLVRNQDINHNSTADVIDDILPSKEMTIENNFMDAYEFNNNNNNGYNTTSLSKLSEAAEKMDNIDIVANGLSPQIIIADTENVESPEFEQKSMNHLTSTTKHAISEVNPQTELELHPQLQVEAVAETEPDSNPLPQQESNPPFQFESNSELIHDVNHVSKGETKPLSSGVSQSRRSKRDTVKKATEPVAEISRSLRKRLGGKVEKATRAIANTTVPKRAPKGFRNMLIKSCLGVKRVLVNTKIVLEEEPENKALKFEKSVLAPIVEEDECVESN